MLRSFSSIKNTNANGGIRTVDSFGIIGVILLLLLGIQLFIPSQADALEFMPNSSLATLAAQVETAQNDTGFLERWNTEDQLYFVQLLIENGLIHQDDQWYVAPEAAVDALHALVFAMQSVYGEKSNWSIEQFAWRDQVLVAWKILDRPINVLPEEDELTKDEALEIAHKALNEQCNMNNWDAYQTILCTYTDMDDGNGPFWTFEFAYPFQIKAEYIVTISKGVAGVVLHRNDNLLDSYYNDLMAEKGLFRNWSIKDKATFSKALPSLCEISMVEFGAIPEFASVILQHKHGIPDDHAVSQTIALQLAKDTLTENGVSTIDILDSLIVSAFYLTDLPTQPQWLFEFYDKSIKRYAATVDAYTQIVTVR